jgi:hypothetical protein
MERQVKDFYYLEEIKGKEMKWKKVEGKRGMAVI